MTRESKPLLEVDLYVIMSINRTPQEAVTVLACSVDT